jgi:hypothetical protein
MCRSTLAAMLYPQLYSKLQANAELRKMLNTGRSDHRNDMSRLSDPELIARLSDTAKEPKSRKSSLSLKRSGSPEILEPQRR